MTPEALEDLLERVRRGDTSVGAAAEELRHLSFQDIGVARVDTHRRLRQGIPEVILGAGKSAPDIVAIARSLVDSGSNVLVTRLEKEAADAVQAELSDAQYNATARALVWAPHPCPDKPTGRILIVTAGTSDLPAAEEAAVTAEFLGSPVDRLSDVGVAGIHRLLEARQTLDKARIIIVVAGMEGALPSVVGGLVSVPVIAVPTSVGYGASFGGLAALLGMLNSCAAGITVVNIDNGFGAGCAAHIINRL